MASASSASAKNTQKVNAALLPKSLNKTFEVTLAPPSLASGGIDNSPNLSRGVIHLRHWLNLQVTVNIANANTTATTVGGTASPNGALDYLQQIYYSANNIDKFYVLSGQHAFKIGMWQMGINAQTVLSSSSPFRQDSIITAPTASIPASENSNFTANYWIPVTFSGTHTTTPSVLGFSTLNPSITVFEINASFGTVASMLSGIASGLTASITAASLSVYSEFYPPNLGIGDVAGSYEPPYYTGLAQANTAEPTGATTKGSIGGIPYGSSYVYKSLFLFVDNTSTSPFYTPSDDILTSIDLKFNTKNYIYNQVDAGMLKAEAQLTGNNSAAVGMYPIQLIYQGGLNDVLNTTNFSSFNLNFAISQGANLTLIGETINDNVKA